MLSILLREGWREGTKSRKRTLTNLSHWPKPKIETLRRLLRDEELVSPQDLFTTRQTLPHGHVEALLTMIRKLGLHSFILIVGFFASHEVLRVFRSEVAVIHNLPGNE